MKHKNNGHGAPSSVPSLVPVRFEFIHPTATTVCVAGTFNEWHATAKPMHKTGADRWLKETAMAPGAYEYCLVVDGHWMPDPLATDCVPNPYGGRNSVLTVVRLPGAAELADAAHLVEAETLPLNIKSQPKEK